MHAAKILNVYIGHRNQRLQLLIKHDKAHIFIVKTQKQLKGINKESSLADCRTTRFQEITQSSSRDREEIESIIAANFFIRPPLLDRVAIGKTPAIIFLRENRPMNGEAAPTTPFATNVKRSRTRWRATS